MLLCCRYSKTCVILSRVLPDGIAFTVVSLCVSMVVTAWVLSLIDAVSVRKVTTTTTTAEFSTYNNEEKRKES